MSEATGVAWKAMGEDGIVYHGDGFTVRARVNAAKWWVCTAEGYRICDNYAPDRDGPDTEGGRTMNDATKVREAAERLRNGEYVYEPRAVLFHFSRSRMNDVCTLADAYISLTDPTPLTLERLVEAGFKPCRIDGHFSRGRLEAARIGKGFDFWVGDTPLQLPPRTVGHLRQLLLRMKEQS